jgi:hypothetical protein
MPFEHYVTSLMEDVPRPINPSAEDVLFFLGDKPLLLDVEGVEGDRPVRRSSRLPFLCSPSLCLSLS